MATSAEIAGAGVNAVQIVYGRDPKLAQRFVSDFLNAGLVGDPTTETDLLEMRALGYGAQATAIEAMLNDPAALKLANGQMFADLVGGSGVLTTLNTTGKALVQVNQNTVNNTATGLSNALNSLNPLGALFQGNIWKRLAEAAIGLVLIAIGLNAFLKDTTGKSLSARVPKVVPV
jgi:hypothetical protein